MRSKTNLSIVAFIAAFGLSAGFAGLFAAERHIETAEFTVSAPEFVPTYQSKTSCFGKSRNASTAAKIAGLIRQDHLNGDESGKTAYDGSAEIFSSNDSTFSGYAGAVERYVDLSDGIKANDLPADFQSEWREHLKAWRDYSNFLNRMKIPSNRVALTAAELLEIDAFHSREINRTYAEVLQIGADFNADFE